VCCAANSESSRSHAVLQVRFTVGVILYLRARAQIFVEQQARTADVTAEFKTGASVVSVVAVRVCQPRSRTTAKLTLIDLAGSERAAVTGVSSALCACVADRCWRRIAAIQCVKVVRCVRGCVVTVVAGANINKSLLALGNCINALCKPVRACWVSMITCHAGRHNARALS
jgi:hypothetical protein